VSLSWVVVGSFPRIAPAASLTALDRRRGGKLFWQSGETQPFDLKGCVANARSTRLVLPGWRAAPFAMGQQGTSHFISWGAEPNRFEGVEDRTQCVHPSNERIYILLDQSGKVSGVVIGVGGFLGIGERDILVGLDKLNFAKEPLPSPTVAATGNITVSRDGPPAALEARAATKRAIERWYPDHAVMNATKDQLKAMT
jgi:hypothetical protein